MWRTGTNRDKSIERAVNDILKSRARSRIYIYLLRKNGARTEEIIKGTRLHPSTVRETLSKMFELNLIYREKIKNDSIGKNPFIYRLNKLASLASKEKIKNYKPVRIRIRERIDKA